jgi:hypothetical protein
MSKACNLLLMFVLPWVVNVRVSSVAFNYFPSKNFVALVRERTIPTERLPLVGEVNVIFCGRRGGSVRSYSRFF